MGGTLCFVAMKRSILRVPEHVAPAVLDPFLDGVVAVLGDFVTFLIWSSVWWALRVGGAQAPIPQFTNVRA